MFKQLISIALITTVLAGAFIFPTDTKACGVVLPETLLSLYKNSDVIVIATFDKTETGESVRDKEEDYSVVKIKTHYNVATTLKGESQKMLMLENEEYNYEPEETAAEPTLEVLGVPDAVAATEPDAVIATEEDSTEGEESENLDVMKHGDTVLMFLRKSDQSEEDKKAAKPIRLELVSNIKAIKKLSGDDLRTYEHRINQLNIIFNSAENRDSAIVNWLIDVTADPVTRWEGAFELLQSFQELEWAELKAKREAESKEEKDTAKLDVTTSDDGETPEEDVSNDRLRYAKLLTDGHKQELLNIFLSRSSSVKTEGEKQEEMSDSDQVLMHLVQQWGDTRLAISLIEQLRASSGNAYSKYQLMETIAFSLKDKKLKAILDEYADRLYEEDETVIEIAKNDEVAQDANISKNGAVEISTNADEVLENTNTNTNTDIDAKPKTYGEFRAELITRFLTAVDSRLITEQSKS